ncbi:MAG: SEFIR domain-containing protein [Cyanobium sp.]
MDPHRATAKPKVFISYAHEGDLRERVGDLAEWLRGNGVEPITDHPYRYRPPEKGWRAWMQHSIEAADVVLIVCSERYQHLFEKREDPAAGCGAIRGRAVARKAVRPHGGGALSSPWPARGECA